MQDREIELWENKRIVSDASPEEVWNYHSNNSISKTSSLQVANSELSVVHPSFRVISTASKSQPLKDWLSDEHANMFFCIPSQPMDRREESDILLSTGCPPPVVETLLSFAEKYRQSISVDNILKNRKLGTRSLVRIGRRLAMFPQDDNLHMILCQSLLAEFLPVSDRMNLETLLEEATIEREIPPVRSSKIVCRVTHDMNASSTQAPSSKGPLLFSLGPTVQAIAQHKS